MLNLAQVLDESPILEVTGDTLIEVCKNIEYFKWKKPKGRFVENPGLDKMIEIPHTLKSCILEYESGFHLSINVENKSHHYVVGCNFNFLENIKEVNSGKKDHYSDVTFVPIIRIYNFKEGRGKNFSSSYYQKVGYGFPRLSEETEIPFIKLKSKKRGKEHIIEGLVLEGISKESLLPIPGETRLLAGSYWESLQRNDSHLF